MLSRAHSTGTQFSPGRESSTSRGDAPVSHETLYKLIYVDKQAGGQGWRSFRCCKKSRKRYGSGRQRRGRKPNQVGIGSDAHELTTAERSDIGKAIPSSAKIISLYPPPWLSAGAALPQFATLPPRSLHRVLPIRTHERMRGSSSKKPYARLQR